MPKIEKLRNRRMSILLRNMKVNYQKNGPKEIKVIACGVQNFRTKRSVVENSWFSLQVV